jgi:hypothetical protein
MHAAEAADAAQVLPDGDLTRAAIDALGRRLR